MGGASDDVEQRGTIQSGHVRERDDLRIMVKLMSPDMNPIRSDSDRRS